MGELGKRAALPTPPFLFLSRAMLFITMPILFHVERNNLKTQCIMRFSFLVKDYDGFSHPVEKEFESIDAAEEWARGMVMDKEFVRSVTMYQVLTNDSCGPIKYVNELRYEDL